jgi:hypothetical protein
MSPQRRIRYQSAEAAERAGKSPCWMCLPGRAEDALKERFGGKRTVQVVVGRGPIVGYEGELHAPNCEKILDKPLDRMTSFKTVKEARRAGLKPCGLCLRLDTGGKIPEPLRGECIGRAPPHRRPCLRAPADESGLCPYCLGRGE